MAKDKGHRTTEKNLEYNSERAENYRADSVKNDTKKQLKDNLSKGKKR